MAATHPPPLSSVAGSCTQLTKARVGKKRTLCTRHWGSVVWSLIAASDHRSEHQGAAVMAASHPLWLRSHPGDLRGNIFNFPLHSYLFPLLGARHGRAEHLKAIVYMGKLESPQVCPRGGTGSGKTSGLRFTLRLILSTETVDSNPKNKNKNKTKNNKPWRRERIWLLELPCY